MNSNVAQCSHLLFLAESILAGLDDRHLALEPHPGAKTAGWLIGHLAVTGDFGRRICGRTPLCPKDWRAKFNPGSQPSRERDEYPAMSELTEAFRAVYADLCEAATSVDPAALSDENPYAPGRIAFPTSGDFLAYLMAGHLGYHLGQLATWRAAAGVAGRIIHEEGAVAPVG
ncbi:MAG: DinB family protein [Gemmatimonadaceae bacterium]